MSNLTSVSRRIEARERLMAAVHEAGHVIMAVRCGFSLHHAGVIRVTCPGPDEKTWRGSVIASPRRKQTARERARVGVAGIVAESCWDRQALFDTDWDDPDVMSETDWAMAGCEPGYPSNKMLREAEAIAQLFNRDDGELWPELMGTAMRLKFASRQFS